MQLSDIKKRVIKSMQDGEILVSAKDQSSAWMQRLTGTYKVSAATLRSLLKHDLVVKAGDMLTVTTYKLTPKGKKH